MNKLAACIALSAALGLATSCFAAGAKGVQVVPNEAAHRVDIIIDGQPFTSYIWPSTLKKPTLYPLIAADGIGVTRGYPLQPRPGERVDHPHHAGLWFNYGNVNGFDFWNNSDAIPPENRSKMGSIVQKKILSATSGQDKGELVVESIWITGSNQELLKDTTRYVFSQHGSTRVIDRITTLEALDKAVFNDDKEGALGLRVARWLESPEEKGGTFTDANGNPTQVDAMPATGPDAPSGEYLSSEGVKGGKVWSTRGRWCALTGHTGAHTVTIAILDHPQNPGYPTYWHARGYGLFAANPLGRSIFDPQQPPFHFTIEKGHTATFRYRILIDTSAANPAELNRQADAFASAYK